MLVVNRQFYDYSVWRRLCIHIQCVYIMHTCLPCLSCLPLSPSVLSSFSVNVTNNKHQKLLHIRTLESNFLFFFVLSAGLSSGFSFSFSSSTSFCFGFSTGLSSGFSFSFSSSASSNIFCFSLHFFSFPEVFGLLTNQYNEVVTYQK